MMISNRHFLFLVLALLATFQTSNAQLLDQIFGIGDDTGDKAEKGEKGEAEVDNSERIVDKFFFPRFQDKQT